MANNGPISGIAMRVSKAADLFKDVPLISSVAGQVSWASSMLANAAAAFGWSNPNAQNNVHYSKLNLANDICNVNAIGNNTSLGLLSDNAVPPLPGFAGTDIDEMSFNYLTSIPSYIYTGQIATTNTYGQNIVSINLRCDTMGLASASSPGIFYPTPMCYIANFFSYWRTGFTFTFKFVKTEFHSGRYALVFSPTSAVAPAWADTSYLYREILDLRESNEFTITVPYTATLPYLMNGDQNATQSFNQIGQTMGLLTLYCLNPLVAPTTVSQTVNYLVEVCADNTFEVAMPRLLSSPPCFYVPGTGAPSFAGPPVIEEEEDFHAQALGQDVQDKEKETTYLIGAPSITGLANQDGGIESAAHCVGEKVVSFRTLAKRAAPYIAVPAANTNSDMSFRPKLLSLTNKSDNVTTQAPTGADYISMIAPLYNYQRGSLKFFAYQPMTSNSVYLRASLSQNYLDTTPVLYNATPTQFYENPLAIATGPPIAGGLSFYVPQYARTQSEMYRLYTTTYTQAADLYCSDLRVHIRSLGGSTSLGGLKILRQAGDDWSCGFFTGCLPLDKTGSIYIPVADY